MKKGLFSRLVACILVLAMLVEMVPLNVLAQEADIYAETMDATITQEQVGPQETESTALGNGDYVTDDAYIVNEIVENRTEFTKEFQLSNGLHMAAVYPEAVHYNNDGEWEDIDNTLRLSENDESASYINTAGIWDIELPELLTENKAVTVTKDGYTLQFFMAGELHSDPDAEVMSEPEDTSVEESPSDLQMPSDTATEPTVAETVAEGVDTTEPIATEASIVDTTEIVSDTETEPAIQQDDSEEDETDPSETVATFEQETEENEVIKGTAVEETIAEEVVIQETVAETTSISDAEKAIPDEADIKEDVNKALENADKEETVPTEAFEDANNDKTPADAKNTKVETGPKSESQIIFEKAETVKGQVQAIDMSRMLESAEHPEMFSEKLRSRLKYAEVYSNTDIIYDLTSNQLKESIVISEYDPTLCGYQYSLNVGKLTPVLLDDGKIELYDEAGKKLVMEMPAPYLYDDAGSYCYDITVALEENGDTYALTYTLPQTWMADTERQWPVVLDPIVEATKTNSSITNRTVSERPAGATEPATPDLACGFDQYLDVARFYIKYDTTTLPQLTSADVIINATITLNMVDRRGDPLDIEVHTVTENWESNQMTWDSQPSFDKTIEDVTNCYENHQDYYWNITDIVRSWYTGDNFGMVFKASDYVESREEYIWKSFYSVNSSPATYPPVLTITYRNSNGLESYWDYTSSSAGRAGTGYVNNYTGNLVWVHNDIGFGGNRMPVSINHVYNSNDSLINYYGMGYGWRTNYNQRIYYWSSEHSAVGNCYVWEDGDGTAHYFIKESGNVYKDEDGLELTFEVVNEDSWKYTITDKYGNQSFFDSNGRLVKLKDNQEEENSIKISYTATTGKLISTIRDGAGRVYSFTYSGNLLDKISYLGTDNTEHGYVSYTYTNSKLSSITYMDSKSCGFTYTTNNLMSSATDIDGYKLEYEYYTVEAGLPNRIEKISEIDEGVSGGSLTFEYAQNQTKVTDISGNVQIMQFNNFGNTVSIQDDQGRAMYAKYALNNLDETVNYENPKGNQLRWISKLQNTVGNVLDDSSFENGTMWSPIFSSRTTRHISTDEAYLGSKSLAMVHNVDGSSSGLISPSFTVGAGETYTFSAYLKTVEGSAYLSLSDGSIYLESECLEKGAEWSRLEVSYTNNGSSNVSVTARVQTSQAGTTYIDCVQVEKAPTASRYNLLENGDFRHTSGWSATSGRTTAEGAGIEPAPALELSSDVYSIIGSPSSKIRIAQTVSVSGQKDDCFVLAGWAKGISAPLEESGSHSNREFGIIATFNNTDGTTTKMEPISFNPYVENWQYVSVPLVAKQAYSSIKIELAYDYNVNTVYFDGIQLFKEMFGHSYTYDENGNVTSVIDLQEQTTTYEYDEETNDLLTESLPTGAKMTYTYDDFHNVETATTETGVQYSFDYDQYGNNTLVSIGSGSSKITSTAKYSPDGNCLVSTTDAAGNVTTYEYNADTNVLEWVQYPEDTSETQTKYNYDEMYRLESVAANTSGGSNLFAKYEYMDDLLSEIETASTTYSFTYGDFDLRSRIAVGNRNLASYSYEDRTNYLARLDYGNGDHVKYEYDQQGRVTTQSYEDGDTISYKYDNNGALATITDSETGITTTYYYDFTDRLMKYVESASDYIHSVAYEYDLYNNMLALVEVVNGSTYTTTYDYDKENRVTSINVGNDISETYTYDNWGRVNKKAVKKNNSAILSETIGYVSIGSNTTGQVGTLTVDSSSYDVSFKYTYDKNGNILSVVSGGKTTSYEYDSSNQLIRENNQAAGKTWVWAYDNAGNILSRKQYAYTTADDVGTAEETVLYGYNDTMGWGDLLTSYDGQSIEYDEIGNPTERDGWILTWKHGRELASISNADANPSNQVTTDFVYNADGLRTRKTVTTNVYENIEHTVTFVADGVTVDTRTVPDGHTLTDAEYPAVPEKNGYTGSWPEHSDPITADTTITAVYTAIETAPEDTTHTVTFKVSYGSNSYGSTLKTMTVENGYVLTDADYPTSRMSYYTITWNKYTSPVTSDITVTGTYTRPSTTTTHTVTFVADGVTVDTLTVSNGHTLTDDEYPAVPEKSGYTGSWPEHSDPITADTTITAVYTAIATEPEETEPEGTTHTVKFKVSYGSSSYGTTMKTITVADGYVLTDADYPTSSMGYYTIKWNKYTSPITSDITVNGTYSWGSTSSEETEEEPDLVISDEYTAPTLGGKLVSSVTEQYDYVYNGSTLTQLTKMTTSGSETQTEVLHFSYDAGGMPMAVTYNGTDYYYVTNLQGDVMAILDSAGKAVVNYTYDAWGSILTTTGTMAESLGETNPLRYRGYVYDSELGLYYLQSRYYDPEMGRFINADILVSTGTLLGHNIFAYCENTPVICKDSSGCGKTYVIYYDSKETGFENQAENSPYYTTGSEDVVMVGVTTNREFVDAWNSIEGDTDDVYLYLHGGQGVLFFYNENLRFPNDKNTTSSLSFGDLESKSINEGIYLFSCDGGKGDIGSNVAFMFAELANTKVRACTGHVSYAESKGKYYARKAFDQGLWYTYFYHNSYLLPSVKYAVFMSVNLIA